MFFCGDDDDAKSTVEDILVAFGWEPVDIGGIEGRPAARAAVHPVGRLRRPTGTWGHAFKLLRR